jgi:hypothetical protein
MLTRDPFTKPFAWSYSRLKNYETCPYRHLRIDIIRDVREPESDDLKWGNRLHDAMARAIGTDDNASRPPRDRIVETPLPPELAHYQPWVSHIRLARDRGATVICEKGYAITRDFLPCDWFDSKAWFRVKVDASIFSPDMRFAAAFDWKSGKRLIDSPQLQLTAIVMFVHYPTLQDVRTEFVWLKDVPPGDAMLRSVDRETFNRASMVPLWNGLAQRVQSLESAYQTRQYNQTPSGLCRRWCPVTSCPHNGK